MAFTEDISHRPDRIVSNCGTGWELLAAAIIEKACDDYKTAIFVNDYRRQREIEHFLRSKYFNTISTLNPSKLIPKLREKFEEEKQQKLDKKRPGRPRKFEQQPRDES